MMQPCASTARFRAAGPFSETAWKPCLPRVTATSDRHQRPADPDDGRRIPWRSVIVNWVLTPRDGARRRAALRR